MSQTLEIYLMTQLGSPFNVSKAGGQVGPRTAQGTAQALEVTIHCCLTSLSLSLRDPSWNHLQASMSYPDGVPGTPC